MPPLTIYLIAFSALTLIGVMLALAWWRWSTRAQPAEPATALKRKRFTLKLPGGGQPSLTISPEAKPDPKAEVLDIPPGKSALIRVSHQGDIDASVGSPPWYAPGGWLPRLQAAFAAWPYSLAHTLFIAGLLIYTLTRLVGIRHYPIFFFTDEAVQSNLAFDFIRDNFHNYDGEFFPTYFENVDKYSLSLTVYAQILPLLLFGRSVLVTRATAALITVLGAYWLSLTLRDIFKIKNWWLGALLLAVSPAWLLHSRTAFETCMFATLYAGFLYYYLSYRCQQPQHLYPALLLGALAFYSYNPGRLVVVLTGVLLLVADLPYHWQQRKTGVRGLGLLLLLVLPFVRFYLAHPTSQVDQLRLLASYWISPMPLAGKIDIFFENYWRGLGPGYWFLPHNHDLVRHRMGMYPHLLSQTLVFAFFGLMLSLRRFKQPAYRVVLLALLIAPTSSALVSIGITRIMVYIIPAVLLTALGLQAALDWLGRRGLPNTALSLGLFWLLAGTSLGLTGDALINGPTWSHEYGLTGMQYGARQMYARVRQYLQQHPDTNFFISPNWTNGANVVARFFLWDPLPVELGGIDGYTDTLQDDIHERVFVLPPEEYQTVIESGKFKEVRILDTIPYPDGNPGFYFLQLEYSDEIGQMLLDESELRQQLQHTSILIGNEIVDVKHSYLDLGVILQLFDGNIFGPTRTASSNPYVVELSYPSRHRFSSLRLVIGSAFVFVTVEIDQGSRDAVVYSQSFTGSVDQPQVILEFDPVVATQKVHIEVLDLNHDEPANVHLWELELVEQ